MVPGFVGWVAKTPVSSNPLCMSARSESTRHDWDRLSLLSKTKDDKATRQGESFAARDRVGCLPSASMPERFNGLVILLQSMESLQREAAWGGTVGRKKAPEESR